ncbi:MAG: hypothetical protein Q8N23_03850 [Archangium sp.]|nr:hypothetical protein [Archangium sp.]MDP3573297.1 hypothetical protein [Archangium sp.]
MPSISRLVFAAVPLEPEVVPLPVRNSVEAFPSTPRTEDEVTLERVLRAKPSLVLPDHLSTAAAKLLYVVTHRELSRGLAPLSVRVGLTDHVRLQTDGGLSLASPGKPTLQLHNRHGDLAKLLEGAHVYEASSIEALLQEAVHRFYVAGQFDGGGAAANERGERAFTFSTIQQVLVSPDPSQPGLECLASAAVHLWKSAGLVPPGLSREEFEHRYTAIHGERGGVRLGPEFNKTLRGGRSERRLDANATAAFANELRADDWAKLTGAAGGRYFVRTLPSIEAVVKHFDGGGAGVRSTWADGGHYFVLSGAKKENGEIFVNEDDSLRFAPARRKSDGDEPYRTPYDARLHTRFWTLDRS